MPSLSTPADAARAALPAGAALTLDQLPLHTLATVMDVRMPEASDERDVVLRLIEIGFVPGERIRVVAHGFPGREPLAVRLGHTTFALRAHEASFITVAPGGAA